MLLLIQDVSGTSCQTLKQPSLYGGLAGDTELLSIDIEYSSGSNAFLVGGYSKDAALVSYSGSAVPIAALLSANGVLLYSYQIKAAPFTKITKVLFAQE